MVALIKGVIHQQTYPHLYSAPANTQSIVHFTQFIKVFSNLRYTYRGKTCKNGRVDGDQHSITLNTPCIATARRGIKRVQHEILGSPKDQTLARRRLSNQNQRVSLPERWPTFPRASGNTVPPSSGDSSVSSVASMLRLLSSKLHSSTSPHRSLRKSPVAAQQHAATPHGSCASCGGRPAVYNDHRQMLFPSRPCLEITSELHCTTERETQRESTAWKCAFFVTIVIILLAEFHKKIPRTR